MATLTRRTVLTAAVGVAAAMRVGLPDALAQSGTPASGDAFAALGYPELNVTITDGAFEGVADSVPAGRYLLQVTSKVTDASNGGGAVGFLSGAALGMSGADLLQLLANSGGPTVAASPSADATPAANGDQNQVLPLEVYQLHFAGGAEAIVGQTVEAVIDLTPGDYLLWGDDPTAKQQPMIVKVTGEYPKDVKEPKADVTATLVDFAITFEGNLTAGRHILEVEHKGAQPHFLFLAKGPDTMTKEQAMAAISADPNASPVAGGLNQQDLQPVFYSPTQSIGTVTYHDLDLEAGAYLAACFFPTAGTGVPHAMNGMVEVVKVTG